MGTAAGRLSSRAARAFRAHAAAQCVHEVDDLGRLALFGRFDLLARALLLQQLLQRILVVIFEFFRTEMSRFGVDDVGGERQHVLRDFLVLDLVDLDRARALYGDGLEFLGFELDVFALADFVAFDDVGRVDFLLGLRVHFAVSDAVAGVLVDLMKPDFFALAARGKEWDRTRDEREFQVAFPIRARGHGGTPIPTRINERESYPVPATPWRRLPPWQVCVADLFSPALPVKLHCRGDSSRSNPWLLPPLNQGPRSGPSTPLCTSRAWSNGASKRCPPSTRTSCSLPALATAARSASASTSRSSRS